MNQQVQTDTICHYCGDTCGQEKVVIQDLVYCCYGCATLDNVVQKMNAQDPEVSIQYKQFDLPGNFNEWVDFKNDKVYKISFTLPSIHCSSCIELLEDLPAFHEQILSSRVNFEQRRCSIVASLDYPLSKLAQLLDNLGYPPQVSIGLKQQEEQQKIKKRNIFKMAVAGFCFGNIMLFSMPHYFGLELSTDPFFSQLFKALSIALSLPVLLYSGREYLTSAYKALLAGRTHINIPIAIGIVSLWGWSIYEILSGMGPGYLDSLAGLIFFLLIGKWFQTRIYDQVTFHREVSEFIPLLVRKHTPHGEEWTHLSTLDPGDRIMVKNGEVIPAEGILDSPNTWVDYSFITGEQEPEEVTRGNKVYCGGKNVRGQITIAIQERPDVQALWSGWNAERKEEMESGWSNRVSKYFTWAVLIIATLSGVVWAFVDPSKWVFVFTAVLIVACPCALALSAPFTYGAVARVFSRNNFFIKQTEKIGSLAQVARLAFDKTGTLTQNKGMTVHYQGMELTKEEMAMVRTIAAQSNHPLSRTLHEHLPPLEPLDVTSFEMVEGSGIQGQIEGMKVQLGSANWLGQEATGTEVWVSLDGVVKGRFNFSPAYRKGLKDTLESLGEHYPMSILSGDNDRQSGELKALYPHFSTLAFDMQPQDKALAVEQWNTEGKTAMIGDGLNDSAALKSGQIGIAVTETLNGFYPGADAVLLGESFSDLPKFFSLARYTRSVLRASLVFSLSYNLIGLGFAVSGNLTPVIAAILMPVSSVTVVLLDTVLIRLKAKTMQLA